MKKNLSKIVILVLLVCLVISFYPVRLYIQSYAQSQILGEAKIEYDNKLHKKDSVFRTICTQYGNFYCALYHNMTPRFESVFNLDEIKNNTSFGREHSFQLDYLKKYGVKIDDKTYFCNPNFSSLGIDLRVMCQDIMNTNKSKGRDPYIPLNGGSKLEWFQTGWGIGWIGNSFGEDNYSICIIYPAFISIYGTNINATIYKALKESYEYYTRNEKSEYTNCDTPERFKHFASFCVPNNENSYYRWVREKDFNYMQVPYLSNGYVYSSDYIVFTGHTEGYKFILKLDEEYLAKKSNEYSEKLSNIQIVLSIVMGSILLILLIVLLVQSHRKNKKQQETILHRIIVASHPKRFIENYDKERLETANTIYDKAINTNENDKEVISILCKEVEDKLGLSLITRDEITALKEKCNPKHFMTPYDAQKVSKANELYSKLNSDHISCSDYFEIAEQIDEMTSKDSLVLEEQSPLTKSLEMDAKPSKNDKMEAISDNNYNSEKPHKKNYSLVLYICVAILVLFASLFAIPKSHLGMIIFMNLFGWAVIIGRYLHRKNKEEKA